MRASHVTQYVVPKHCFLQWSVMAAPTVSAHWVRSKKTYQFTSEMTLACIWNLTCQTFTVCSSLVGLQLWLTDCWHLLSQALGKKDSYRRASTSQVPSSGAQTQIGMAICQPVSIHIGNQITLQHLHWHLTSDIWSDNLTCQTFTFCASALYCTELS